MEEKLYRSRTDRVIWGVCGGLAKYLDMDPTIVRIAMVLLVFANGIGLVAYLIMAILIPLEGSKAAELRERVRENVEEIKETATKLGQELHEGLAEKEESQELSGIRRRRRNVLGIILIILGLVFLSANFNLFWWFDWGKLWPILIVAVGALLILSARRKHA